MVSHRCPCQVFIPTDILGGYIDIIIEGVIVVLVLAESGIIMPDSHESSLENDSDSRLLSMYPLADVFCRRRLGTGVCPYPNFDFFGPYLLPFGLPWAAGADLRRSSADSGQSPSFISILQRIHYSLMALGIGIFFVPLLLHVFLNPHHHISVRGTRFQPVMLDGES